MKKIFIFSLLFMGMLGVSVTHAAQLPENQPVLGEESTTTDFYSHWQPASFGANRLGDTGVVMALTSGFGQRAGFRSAYNVTDFEMSLDLTYVDPGIVITTFFGPQGSYIGGNGALLSIEFVKHTTEAGKYLVAIQAGSFAHNVSMDEFIDVEQGDWEDSAWKGYHVVATDHVMSVSILEANDNVTVTINGTEFTVASSKFYADFPDKTNSHFLIGALNFDNSIQTVTAHYVLDQQRRTYFEANGVYDTFKSNLEALEAALLVDLTDVDNVTAAQAINENLDLDTLYNYDQNYFQPRYDDAVETLDVAITELGGDIVLNNLESDIVRFETAITNVINFTTAQTALNRQATAQTTLTNVDSTEFTVEQTDRLNLLEGRLNVAKASLLDTIDTIVDTQVTDFASAVEDLTTIEMVNAAVVKQGAISQNLINLLSEVKQTSYQNLIAQAQSIFDDAVNNLDNWLINEDTYVVVNEDRIEATFLGSALGEDGTGIFYDNEKLDLRNFQMNIDISSLTTVGGGWISFGIMQNPEIFSAADDNSVQDNKGLFFLIINQGLGKARVEIYHLTLYSNRFFDAQIQETLIIDIDEAFDIVLTTELKTVSGVTDEYMSITIAGQQMATALTLRSMRTSLEDYLGYLYITGQSGTPDNPNTVKINEINGLSPLSESLVISYLPEPEMMDESGEYTLGSEEGIEIDFYNRGLDVTVKVNDVILQNANYTFANDRLTLTNTYLETLTPGTYTVLVSTEAGEGTYTLTILETPEEPADETGMGTVAIVVVSSLVVVGGGAGAFVLIKKRKIV